MSASLVTARHAQATARRVHGDSVADLEPVAYAGFVTRTIAFALDAALIDVAAVAAAAVVALVFSVFPVSSGVHDAAVAAGGVLFVIWTIVYFTTFWTTTARSNTGRSRRPDSIDPADPDGAISMTATVPIAATNIVGTNHACAAMSTCAALHRRARSGRPRAQPASIAPTTAMSASITTPTIRRKRRA